MLPIQKYVLPTRPQYQIKKTKQVPPHRKPVCFYGFQALFSGLLVCSHVTIIYSKGARALRSVRYSSFSRWHLVLSPGVTKKPTYHQFSQVQPLSSHLTPHSQSQIHARVTRRCLQQPLKHPGFPVINSGLSTPAPLGFQRREGHQEAGTHRLTIRSYDMMYIFSRTAMSHF